MDPTDQPQESAFSAAIFRATCQLAEANLAAATAETERLTRWPWLVFTGGAAFGLSLLALLPT